MGVVSAHELLDIVVMTLFVGFIFKDMVVPKERFSHTPLYSQRDAFIFSILVTAPAIIFHEMAHKFVALALGLSATFHAAYLWLFFGVALKIVGFPFIFFVPGYVSHSAAAPPLYLAMVAVAGPLMNLLIFLASAYILKKTRWKRSQEKIVTALVLTKKINLFLFIFNMIPISPFDGGHFFIYLLKAIF